MGLAQTQNSNEFIIAWNNTFPLDRWWRNKWKVALFSKEHLEVDPINQILEWVEEKEFEKYAKEMDLAQDKKQRLDQGEWITSRGSNGKLGFSNKEFDDFDLDNIIIE